MLDPAVGAGMLQTTARESIIKNDERNIKDFNMLPRSFVFLRLLMVLTKDCSSKHSFSVFGRNPIAD
jgi:hypothetical protein